MNIDKYHYRTSLLKTFSEKKYSQLVKEEIMLLFGSIPPSKKEEVAKKAIPLVETSKTEQEAKNKIMQLVKQVNKNIKIRN